MAISTFIKLGKTAIKGKQAYDNFDPNAAYGVGKKAATAPLRAYENVPRWILRGLQLLMALVVVGFYGHRVDVDRRAGTPQSGEWIYGVTVAGLSGVTAVVFALAGAAGAFSDRLKTHRLWAWDFVVFILWIVAFGLFAGIFLKRDDALDYKGASPKVMRPVVWLDLVNAVLWAVSGVYGVVKVFLGRKIDARAGKITDKVAAKLNKGNGGQSKEYYEV